jgi:hypothetical protein
MRLKQASALLFQDVLGQQRGYYDITFVASEARSAFISADGRSSSSEIDAIGADAAFSVALDDSEGDLYRGVPKFWTH